MLSDRHSRQTLSHGGTFGGRGLGIPRCLANLYEDLHTLSRLRDCRRRLHKHLTAAVIEIEFLVFYALLLFLLSQLGVSPFERC